MLKVNFSVELALALQPMLCPASITSFPVNSEAASPTGIVKSLTNSVFPLTELKNVMLPELLALMFVACANKTIAVVSKGHVYTVDDTVVTFAATDLNVFNGDAICLTLQC